MADAYAAQVAVASIHTADPGPTGTAGEVTGGSPAYSRKPVIWQDAADGQVQSEVITFDLPAGTEVDSVGLWAADGTFLDSMGASGFVDEQNVYRVTLKYTQS